MKTKKVQIKAWNGINIPDGRKFGNGPTGGSTYAGRTAIAMQMIGKVPGTVFTDLTQTRDRRDFWRAIDYLRGRTYAFHRIPHTKKTELFV